MPRTAQTTLVRNAPVAETGRAQEPGERRTRRGRRRGQDELGEWCRCRVTLARVSGLFQCFIMPSMPPSCMSLMTGPSSGSSCSAFMRSCILACMLGSCIMPMKGATEGSFMICCPICSHGAMPHALAQRGDRGCKPCLHARRGPCHQACQSNPRSTDHPVVHALAREGCARATKYQVWPARSRRRDAPRVRALDRCQGLVIGPEDEINGSNARPGA